MIEVEALSFRYKNALDYALRGASCTADSAGTTAIVGRSGTGKSTLMALISGIYTARDEIVGDFEGKIALDGHQPDELRGPRTVSWVPQQPALLDHLTVTQNILLPLSMSGVTPEARDHCVQMLATLDMSDRHSARPRELSGGMRTRVSIARALISRPTYLFLDEPFISLDIANRWGMYKLLFAERRSEGLCTLLTTHDIPEALLLADRILVLRKNDGVTSINIIKNSALDPGSSSMAELLSEARRRATELERLIYSN